MYEREPIEWRDGVLLFLSQVLLAAWMAADDFGTYSFAWACVAILGTLAGLGMPGTSVRFIAKYDAEGDPSRLRGLLRFCRVNSLVAAIVTTLLAVTRVAMFAGETRYSGALRLSFLAIPALALLNLDAAYARSRAIRRGLCGAAYVLASLAQHVFVRTLANDTHEHRSAAGWSDAAARRCCDLHRRDAHRHSVHGNGDQRPGHDRTAGAGRLHPCRGAAVERITRVVFILRLGLIGAALATTASLGLTQLALYPLIRRFEENDIGI